MHVGIIGAGAIGQAPITRLTAAGTEDITVANSRGPQSLTRYAEQFGGRVRPGTVREACPPPAPCGRPAQAQGARTAFVVAPTSDGWAITEPRPAVRRPLRPLTAHEPMPAMSMPS
ncbi:NAD(P)-binding domain-containing protein [Streptomyces sp. NPDC001822]|uniref:NAD(P)-binding domain-containing protein n=1 Tax=Streptomyces sp. NPDC001822 TaxID=3364614 RepID=UPI0036CEC5C0